MTRVTCKIKDVISEVKSGDWGKGSPTENYTTEVLCVRGADIPELCKGNVGKMPQRFIHNKKATSKILSANNLIIEISGGSPTQSTGRIALISDKILSRYSKPLICSNFCKAITAKKPGDEIVVKGKDLDLVNIVKMPNGEEVEFDYAKSGICKSEKAGTK